VDLAGVLLGLMAAGGAADDFPWFEAPAPERVESARALLERLGAIDGCSVTRLGHQLRRFPLHPRLARVLVAADGAWEAAAAGALLSEGRTEAAGEAATSCDLLPIIDRWSAVPPHTRQVADTLYRTAQQVLGGSARRHVDERRLRQALLAGYPDRVGRRRATDRTRVVLSSGRGALMSRASAVTSGEWLVALDLTSGHGTSPDALVRSASLVEPEWLVPTSRTVEHRFDDGQTIKAVDVERYDALTLTERPTAADPQERTRLLAAAWRDRGPDAASTQLLLRARLAGVELDLLSLSERAAAPARRLDEIDLSSALTWDERRRLETAAPAQLAVPSGRTVRLTYRDDGTVSAAVKLQELFGLAETPRIGPDRIPVTFELLAPNGRPVQTTRDLRSFWTRTYPEVRKQLRGRYPKHPWPEDPWTAPPMRRR
jgi:ATP-dependent helicase HrpB